MPLFKFTVIALTEAADNAANATQVSNDPMDKTGATNDGINVTQVANDLNNTTQAPNDTAQATSNANTSQKVMDNNLHSAGFMATAGLSSSTKIDVSFISIDPNGMSCLI